MTHLDIRAIFALLPPPGGKGSVAQLIRLSFSALQHSAKVPLVQFPRVREDIRRGLALLAEHLTSPEIGQEIAEASMWYEMHMLFKICVDIAYIPSARGLFTLEVVKPLEFCATRCCRLEPPTWFRDGISDCMKSICSISGYQMSLEMYVSFLHCGVGQTRMHPQACHQHNKTYSGSASCPSIRPPAYHGHTRDGNVQFVMCMFVIMLACYLTLL